MRSADLEGHQYFIKISGQEATFLSGEEAIPRSPRLFVAFFTNWAPKGQNDLNV